MSDMNHMEFLEAVLRSDIMVLRAKEATYQGSWKKAGGRSAWFMLRRNMDRLIEIMKKPTTPATFNLQNVDDTIQAVGESKRLPGTPQATVNILQYLRDCYVSENVFAKIRENPSGDDGTMLACLRDLRRYCVLVEAEMIARGVVHVEKTTSVVAFPEPVRGGTPEDGGHHALQEENN
jgi:hypothetical protein